MLFDDADAFDLPSHDRLYPLRVAAGQHRRLNRNQRRQSRRRTDPGVDRRFGDRRPGRASNPHPLRYTTRRGR